jgi:hypothetical protein
VSAEDLGNETAELLSLMPAGEARSLNKITSVAVSQVPGCSAADASLWRGRELFAITATHPDVAELAELQLRSGCGPMMDALRGRQITSCPDILADARWPGYAREALRRGIRCSVCLVREMPPLTLVMSLYGVRTGVLAPGSEPMTRVLAAVAQAALSNLLVYGDAQRTAAQLKDSVEPRAIVDQAKGILMLTLSCDADRALEHLRNQSQRRHIKVTEVAAQVIAEHTSSEMQSRHSRRSSG